MCQNIDVQKSNNLFYGRWSILKTFNIYLDDYRSKKAHNHTEH